MRGPRAPAPRCPFLSLLLLPLVAAPWGQAVPCVSGGLPKPTNITFLSINMKNVLQWNPPEGLQGVEVTYTVQYFIYGQKRWLNKSECRNINRTYCDLSAETSDYEHQYYAKVKAIWETNCSKWAETGRFYPFVETQIGPPEVALTTDEKSMSIVLTPPEKWKRSPEDTSVSLQQIYSNLKYNVSICNTRSNRMWSQCVTNQTLVLTWLEPDTQYCVHVEAFVPGLPRPARPSEKQCVRTLKDPSSEFKVKIIFWYVLPISVTVFLFSVMGYSIYRYIHVGKERHPANLILIYGNEFDKRFFVPAEKIVINFISLSILDDSKISQKDTGLLGKSISDVSNLNDPKPSRNPEPPQGEEEVKHLGYASHLVEILCDSEENTKGPSHSQQEAFSRAIPTEKRDLEYEYDVRTAGISVGSEDPELSLQQVVSSQGSLCEHRAALAKLDPPTSLYSRAPQLRDLRSQAQEHTDSEEEPEEEPSATLVDWDPRTGRLYISSLSSSDQDSGCEHPENDRLAEEGLLARLYKAQAPDKPPEENETYLLQFKEEWGLYIQMEN
ncbi:interleukin-20 receptor subunit alpha isoform X2 [Nycticebus coucang]|uniref:interleukin-20 receptor subunit alpha isoform X2 n=1 Tax=Nycticebus coucang TaxID=9470 RepID=UPI00234E040D|nr:interleukin-20 receptor subunit alpha isoform X2 [Nycticebus coucang]